VYQNVKQCEETGCVWETCDKGHEHSTSVCTEEVAGAAREAKQELQEKVCDV
jgi:predicted RNA-binding Zn ribbon-like protein